MSKVRCDDPARVCSTKCPTTKEDENQPDILAYARNPKQAGEKYPDISFCPKFYGLRSLGNAIAFGTGLDTIKKTNDITNYYSRGEL